MKLKELPAQSTNRERAIFDKEKLKNISSNDRKYVLQFGNATYFCKSEAKRQSKYNSLMFEKQNKVGKELAEKTKVKMYEL